MALSSRHGQASAARRRRATHDLQASGRATRNFCGIAGIITVWADAVVVRSDTRAASGFDVPHRERLTMPDHVCKADRARGSTEARRKRVRGLAYVMFAHAKPFQGWCLERRRSWAGISTLSDRLARCPASPSELFDSFDQGRGRTCRLCSQASSSTW
jgi:hypothetical protein